MNEPRTEAGRALRDDSEYHEKGCPRWYMVDGSGSCDCQLPTRLLAIEAEARADLLTTLEAEVAGLAGVSIGPVASRGALRWVVKAEVQALLAKHREEPR